MSTPFNPNVPLATNRVSNDQPILLQNNQTLFQAFQANHESLSSAVSLGFHTIINMITQTTTPSGSTTSGTLFSALDSNNIAQLFWKIPTTQGSSVVQITGADSSGSTTTGSFTQTLSVGGVAISYFQYFTALPGGMMVKIANVVQSTAASTGAYLTLPFFNSSGANNFFPTQPLVCFSGLTSGGILSNAFAVPCSASVAPSTPSSILCYKDGVVYQSATAGALFGLPATTYYLILGF